MTITPPWDWEWDYKEDSKTWTERHNRPGNRDPVEIRSLRKTFFWKLWSRDKSPIRIVGSSLPVFLTRGSYRGWWLLVYVNCQKSHRSVYSKVGVSLRYFFVQFLSMNKMGPLLTSNLLYLAKASRVLNAYINTTLTSPGPRKKENVINLYINRCS